MFAYPDHRQLYVYITDICMFISQLVACPCCSQLQAHSADIFMSVLQAGEWHKGVEVNEVSIQVDLNLAARCDYGCNCLFWCTGAYRLS